MPTPTAFLTVAYLVSCLRTDLHDAEAPGEDAAEGVAADEDSLWKTDDFVRFIDNAQRQIARDSLFIQDVYVLNYVIGQSLYKLPDYIFEIREGKALPHYSRVSFYDMLGNPIDGSGFQYDYGFAAYGYPPDEVGTPIRAFLDETDNSVRLSPTPNVDGTWQIKVRRGPKVVVTGTGSPLELNARKYEPAMLAYAKYQAYNQHDAETYDAALAEKWLGLYGVAIDQLDRERKIQRNHQSIVRVPSGW